MFLKGKSVSDLIIFSEMICSLGVSLFHYPPIVAHISCHDLTNPYEPWDSCGQVAKRLYKTMGESSAKHDLTPFLWRIQSQRRLYLK